MRSLTSDGPGVREQATEVSAGLRGNRRGGEEMGPAGTHWDRSQPAARPTPGHPTPPTMTARAGG